MDITREKIIKELGAIAFARATELLRVQGGVLTVGDTEGIPEELSCAIASIEKAPGGIKVKLYDKLKALELLGKYLGLFDGSGDAQVQDNGLLDALRQATGKEVDTHEISELQ